MNVTAEQAPIRIGVSACLLGQAVRFDGGHKRNEFLAEMFGPFVELVPVCPEVEVGMGVPRESVRLLRESHGITMAGVRSGTDHTKSMREYAERRTRELGQEGLSGYVLKKDSPSCGMERVKVYGPSGMPARDGRGLFAEALMRRYPNLPVEEEGRLSDARLRDNFIERVFAYSRLRSFFSGRWTQGRLVEFHTAHKLQLLVHSPKAYAELGRMVANARNLLSPAQDSDTHARSVEFFCHSRARVWRARGIPNSAGGRGEGPGFFARQPRARMTEQEIEQDRNCHYDLRSSIDRDELRERYEGELMRALAKPATPARHVNVMHHMLGYFRTRLDDDSRHELLGVFGDYRKGMVPLIVPITLVRHYVRLFRVEYLSGQFYLEPHPKELMLRNHV